MEDIYLKSIDKTLSFNGMIEEVDLFGVSLFKLTDNELDELLMSAVGYAETLIEFEIEARYEEE